MQFQPTASDKRVVFKVPENGKSGEDVSSLDS
jgi:hypothetical protein